MGGYWSTPTDLQDEKQDEKQNEKQDEKQKTNSTPLTHTNTIRYNEVGKITKRKNVNK